jgi:hypothetical protein
VFGGVFFFGFCSLLIPEGLVGAAGGWVVLGGAVAPSRLLRGRRAPKLHMGDADLILLPDAALLFICSVLTMLEYSGTARLVRPRGNSSSQWGVDDAEEVATTPGLEMRRWIQLALSVAAGTRAVALVLDIVIGYSKVGLMGAYHGLPDMMYLTTFALLVLFWAQLRMVIKGVGTLLLRPVFIGGLSALYLIYGTALLARELAPTSAAQVSLQDAMNCILGSASGIICILLVYFGVSISIATKHKSGLLCRTLLLTLVCSLALAMRGAILLLLGTGALNIEEALPSTRQQLRFYSGFIGAVEVVPSWAVLILTTRRPGTCLPSTDLSVVNGASSFREGSYPNLQSTPLSSSVPLLTNRQSRDSLSSSSPGHVGRNSASGLSTPVAGRHSPTGRTTPGSGSNSGSQQQQQQQILRAPLPFATYGAFPLPSSSAARHTDGELQA